MDLFHWLEDLLPGHHHASSDSALDDASLAPSHAADLSAAGQPTGLGPAHYDTLAGVGPGEPAVEPATSAFLESLDHTLASVRTDTGPYSAADGAGSSTVAGAGDASGTESADPYHTVDSLMQADTVVQSTENDVAIWDDTLSTENQVDSALAGDEGF